MKTNFSFIIGRVAALTISIVTIVFAITLIWEVVNFSEFAKAVGYIACLILAICVVIMMACFYEVTQNQLRIFGLLALVSSIIYAPFCVSAYFLQLSTVALNPINLSGEVIEAINFAPGSPIFALDMLGYCFLCFSTLAAGFALTEAKHKILRILCFFHGALAAPTIASPIMSGLFFIPSGKTNYAGNYVLLFWCIVFVPIALLFMRYFKEEQRP